MDGSSRHRENQPMSGGPYRCIEKYSLETVINTPVLDIEQYEGRVKGVHGYKHLQYRRGHTGYWRSSYPQTGSTGDGYRMAERWDTRSSGSVRLSPLVVTERYCQGTSGHKPEKYKDYIISLSSRTDQPELIPGSDMGGDSGKGSTPACNRKP